MVIPDLSDRRLDDKYFKNSKPPRLALVSDRFLSFVIDFLIFSPIISLLVSGFLKEIRTYLILDSDSPEASAVWTLMILSVFIISVILQTAFLYYFSATPGQIFLKISIQNFPAWSSNQSKKLSIGQCVQRSAFWWVSWLALGLPFFEVIGHSMRRAFYERASDTITVSHSESYDLGPNEIESQFIKNWIRLCFLGFSFIVALYFIKVREQIKMGYFSKNEYIENGRLCHEVPDTKKTAKGRMDLALAMYLSDLLPAECLESEADFVLWKRDPEGKDLASLAKSLVVEEEERADEYLRQSCEKNEHSEACQLALFLQTSDNSKASKFGNTKLQLLSSRVMMLHEMINQKNNLSAVALIQDLSTEKELEPHLQKLYVKTVWNINDTKVKNARSPASAEFEQVVHEFKESYGIK